MDKKQEKLNKILELNQLINKTVFFQGELYKIYKVNTVYIYGDNYEIDNEISINNNIIFLSLNAKPTIYKHYTNNILYGITKIKLSIFFDFKIIDIEKLSDIYFVNDTVHSDYYSSKFYQNKNYIIDKDNIFRLLFSMYHGPMFNKNNAYYFDFRKQILIEHFNNSNLNEEEIKIICNELQSKYENDITDFYSDYKNLFNEYQTYI